LLDETTDVASADKPTREMAKLLNSGMQTLCGVIAIVIGDAPPDGFTALFNRSGKISISVDNSGGPILNGSR